MHTLAQELGEIFTQTGNPVGIIKDCDATLNKGVRLWSQASAAELAVIDDLSHVVATALKKQYESSDAYKQFTDLVNGASQKLRQTAQAFLMPPKLRNKGRFMSIWRLAEWGRKILDVLVGQKDAHNVEMLQKLNAVLPDFAQASEFIKDFANTTQIVSQVMNMLKHQGIEQKTYERCTALSAQLPDEEAENIPYTMRKKRQTFFRNLKPKNGEHVP